MSIKVGTGGFTFLKIPKYDLTSTTFVTDEGTSAVFTFTTDAPDRTYYWKTEGTVSAADFTDSLMSGSFATTAGTANIVRILKNDLLTEGTETVHLKAYKDNTYTGTPLATSSLVDINDTSLNYYAISASSGTVEEGGTATFTFTTTGPDGTFYWTNGGTSTGTDFTDGLTNGSFATTAGTGSIVRTLSSDFRTEDTETLVLSVRSGSISGVTLVSSTVNIADTSIAQYSITNSANSVNEGSSVTFTFTFTTSGPDETFYWTNVGSATTTDFTDSINSGSFITTAGTGSIVRTLRNDTTTEGSESVQIQIRSGSFSGTVVALSSAVTVNDTSTTSVPWTPAGIGIGTSYRSSMVWLNPSNNSVASPAGQLVDGVKISAVFDNYGNHDASQPTDSKRPIYVSSGLNGLPVLRFNGNNDGASLINYSATYGGVYAPTIFAVASKTGAATSFRCITNLGTGSFNAFFGTSGDNFSTFFGNGVSAWNDTNVNTPLANIRNNFNILCVTNDYNTKLGTPFANGTAQNAKNGTMNNSSTGYRIGESAATTQNFPGDIAEILIIPTAVITTDIRLRIEGYLAHKWGLTSKLPANHPYKNSAPMT